MSHGFGCGVAHYNIGKCVRSCGCRYDLASRWAACSPRFVFTRRVCLIETTEATHDLKTKTETRTDLAFSEKNEDGWLII